MTLQTSSTSDSAHSEPNERSQHETIDPASKGDADGHLHRRHDSLDQRSVKVAAVAVDGTTVHTAQASDIQVRNPKLEELWFRLGDPSFVTTAIVPVPGLTSEDAQHAAKELAQVGASITGGPVHVITAVGLHPSQALEASRSIAAHTGDPAIIVVESPTVDPGAIPIVRNCIRALLLVGLQVSRGDHLSEITEFVGSDRVMGAVCLERGRKRHWWHRRRHQKS